MKYVSTRGAAPVLDFTDVLVGGLASDGGLYVPDSWPALPPVTSTAPYAETAAAVISPFVDAHTDADLLSMCRDAYATFRHDAVCPLVQLTNDTWLLELFHGPTLAFKDVALQLVGRMLDAELQRRGERLAIVVATSGDTGSAAIEACRDRPSIDVFVLHPEGRVSEVQRRQMTTVLAPNVHNIALEGTFDDCQDMVKALFADAAFRKEHHLGALNSINWGRVVAQVVYYVTSALSLGATDTRPVSFVVPSGNFGNVFSGWVAQQMGLPIAQLVIGSNRNDILTRAVNTGRMDIAEVVPTMSPSMDIQVSSNFERLLFELNGRDGGLTAEQMGVFRARGHLALEADQLRELHATFAAASVDEEHTLEQIARTHSESGVMVDPHTAVGLAAARAVERDPDIPVIALATAHPAKFPDAVERAIGVRPALPEHLADLFDRPERYSVVANDLDAVKAAIRNSA
ncbi:MAG TPA: threonine synthase [Acidimicrobiales bacterium]|nr:threonine synthase [Acidimicrobiales bacterium]